MRLYAKPAVPVAHCSKTRLEKDALIPLLTYIDTRLAPEQQFQTLWPFVGTTVMKCSVPAVCLPVQRTTNHTPTKENV